MASGSSQPIFVVGTPRSGTTLTARILGRHSRIFMPGETHFLDDIYSRARQLGDVTDREVLLEVARRLFTLYERYYEPEDQQRVASMFASPEDLADALEGCGDYGEVFDRFMRVQMQLEGKQRWGNNAPRDLFSLAVIREFFPGAKLVVCVRDVRAFLYSYKGKWKVVEEAGEVQVRRLKKLYHPVVTSYLWKSSMLQLPVLEKTITGADRVIVRYEDLVTEPEQTVRRICETIEEEFEPAMLEVDSHNSSIAAEAGGIFASSIGRWKGGLSPEEIHIGQTIGRRELERLGYKPVEMPVGLLKLAWLWLGTPYALWRALAANRGTRGPLIPYLFRRVGSLLGTGRQG